MLHSGGFGGGGGRSALHVQCCEWVTRAASGSFQQKTNDPEFRERQIHRQLTYLDKRQRTGREFPFFFFSMQNSPSQGSNPHHSCSLCHSCGNTGSLTRCTRREIPRISFLCLYRFSQNQGQDDSREGLSVCTRVEADKSQVMLRG